MVLHINNSGVNELNLIVSIPFCVNMILLGFEWCQAGELSSTALHGINRATYKGKAITFINFVELVALTCIG